MVFYLWCEHLTHSLYFLGWLWVSKYILTYIVFYYKYFPFIFSFIYIIDYIHIYGCIYTWNCEKVILILSHYKLFVMKSIWWVWKSWKPLILGQCSHLTDGETETQRGDLTSLRSQTNTGRARTNQDQVQSSPNLLPAYLSITTSHFSQAQTFTQTFSSSTSLLLLVIIPMGLNSSTHPQGSLPGCFLWNFSTLFVPLSRHLG